jgi:serine/threonine protein kinase
LDLLKEIAGLRCDGRILDQRLLVGSFQMNSIGNLEEARQCLADQGYHLADYVGSGHFASVYTVTNNRYESEVFCVKIINLQNSEIEDALSVYRAEFNTLLSLTHPNIVSVYAHFCSPNFCFLVLEYCERGSLSELLDRHGPLLGGNLLSISKQILKAVSYLHSCQFAHRDIKPANILIDKYGRPKLADFGFASHNLHSDSKICGSRAYQAPELIKCLAGTDPVACDIWALGVTFYQMAFGRLPWGSRSASGMTADICAAAYSFPPEASRAFTVVIKSMVTQDPNQRRLVNDVLGMPFFAVPSVRLCQSSAEVKLTGRSPTYHVKSVSHATSRPRMTRMFVLPHPSMLEPL